MALVGVGKKSEIWKNKSDTVPSCLCHQLFCFVQGTLQISHPWLVKAAAEKNSSRAAGNNDLETFGTVVNGQHSGGWLLLRFMEFIAVEIMLVSIGKG